MVGFREAGWRRRTDGVSGRSAAEPLVYCGIGAYKGGTSGERLGAAVGLVSLMASTHAKP